MSPVNPPLGLKSFQSYVARLSGHAQLSYTHTIRIEDREREGFYQCGQTVSRLIGFFVHDAHNTHNTHSSSVNIRTSPRLGLKSRVLCALVAVTLSKSWENHPFLLYRINFS